MGQCAGKNVELKPASTMKPKNRRERRSLRKSQKKSKNYLQSNNGTNVVQQQNEERAPLSPRVSNLRSSTNNKRLSKSSEHSKWEDMAQQSSTLDSNLPAAHPAAYPAAYSAPHNTEDAIHNATSSQPAHTDHSNVHPMDDTDRSLSHDVPTSPERRVTPTSPLRRMFASPKMMGGPRVLFKSPLGPNAKQLAFRREKNNSTSTLFIKDTINSPDVDEIIRCMAVALLYHIKNGLKSDMRLDTIFNEQLHPLTREPLDLVNLPDINTIYRFINMIFRVQRLPPECAILCIAYIEKVLVSGRIVLHPTNWRRLVFSSIMMATKVWEDESVWNVDFLDVFPLLTILDLNKMENRFLEYLQFNVITTGSEYAKYYFELRALSQGERFTLEPLNRESQAKLEERSQRTNAKVSCAAVREAIPKRCRSVDNYDPKSPPVTLH